MALKWIKDFWFYNGDLIVIAAIVFSVTTLFTGLISEDVCKTKWATYTPAGITCFLNEEK